jgi:predicted alpha/beta superfamily hydrolase
MHRRSLFGGNPSYYLADMAMGGNGWLGIVRLGRRIGLPGMVSAVVALGGCAHPSRQAPSAATAATAATSKAPVRDTFSIDSRLLGEVRPINVWTPPGYRERPAESWPVLYMPDGGIDEDFPHVVRAVDSLIKAGSIRPVFVVGIPNTQRRRDLTGPTRVKSDSAIAPRVGGAASFRSFIRGELIPAIERRYRVTAERSIIGESLAGLFIVETYLLEPSLFTHYVALDPSLWWNDRALLDAQRAAMPAVAAAPRTLYIATSNEPNIVVPTARLVEMLRALPARQLQMVYEPRTDLTHATIFRATEVTALRHALR